MKTSVMGTAPEVVLRSHVQPFENAADEARVIDWIADAPIVLLGESSHGTEEFYATRARLSRWLIEEKGFAAIAVEGDWPDAYRVNRFVRGERTLMRARRWRASSAFPPGCGGTP